MGTVRPPAVAGLFYPGDAATLTKTVEDLLARAETVLAQTDGGRPPAILATTASDATPDPAASEAAWPRANDSTLSPDPSPHPTSAIAPKGLVVPHAGYEYSGPIAALAYATVSRASARIRRVVLLGPTHRVPCRGLAAPEADGFATPLGVLPVEAPDPVVPHVTHAAVVHEQEHSLEVHLPFLQRALGDVTIAPYAVGHASPDEVAEALAALWGGPETLVVVSSDLSHYLPYDQARAADGETVGRILELRGPLDHAQACGATPVNGLLVAAGHRGLRPRLLGMNNSGDTAGDRRRVVGYASISLNTPAAHATARKGRGEGETP